MLIVCVPILTAYLIGAIPFGYLIARTKGIDLFAVGSGNIGATNVGRVLGRGYGIAVFLLDFLKGAVPVAFAVKVFQALGSDPAAIAFEKGWLPVAAALAAFLGHLFPVYLGFRGGKGVATGAGTVFMLVPGAAALAALIFFAALVSSRIVSLGSIAAAATLATSRLIAAPVDADSQIVTAFCLAAAIAVMVKHRANIRRLIDGRENRLEEKPVFDFWHRAFHLVALGIWLGSGFFFNLFAAPTIFATFKQVAHAEPSDRTAYFSINSGLNDAQMDQLGNALAGAAVGPVFPLFFAVNGVCATVALITALGWWRLPGSSNRWRVILIGLAAAAVATGWPISQKVTEMRLARFAPDAATAAAAKADFAAWHLVSLGLSLLTLVLVFAAMSLAARLPGWKRATDLQERTSV